MTVGRHVGLYHTFDPSVDKFYELENAAHSERVGDIKPITSAFGNKINCDFRGYQNFVPQQTSHF